MSTQAIINEEYPEVHIGTSAPADGAVIWVDTGDENVTESAVYDFDSLALLRAQTAALSVGMRVRTCGYYSKDDGGGALYEICSANTVSGEYYETLSEGDGALYARFIPVGSSVNIRQFGAKQSAWSAVCDEKTDSSRSIQSAVDFIYAHLKTMTNVVLPAGRYDIAHTVEIPPFVRLLADGHVELVAKFQRPTGTQLYYLSDAGVMVQAGNDKITDEDTIIYEKIEYAAGKYAYYEYSVPMLHIKSRYHKVGDQTVIDGHPLCDDYNGSTISNAYLIGGDGNLYFLNDSDKNKSSSGYTSRFISGIKIGTEQESLNKDKNTYIVPSDPNHSGGTYNNFRIGGIRIRDMKHGILVHPINFFSDRFRDMVFQHCGVGFKYGSRYYLPGASDGAQYKRECEEQNNSGELISFESCAFTGNDIDVDYNAPRGDFFFDKCNFDFSRCAHHIDTNAVIYMSNCHIEGVAADYKKSFYDNAPDTRAFLDNLVADKVPFGIVYSDTFAKEQCIYLEKCAVLDSDPIMVPLFNFLNSGDGDQSHDGHFGDILSFNDVTYYAENNIPMCFYGKQKTGTGSNNNVNISHIIGGFLVGCYDMDMMNKDNPVYRDTYINIINKGIYPVKYSSKARNIRPLSDRDLLLKKSFFSPNSGDSSRVEITPLNEGIQYTADSVNSPMKVFDSEAVVYHCSTSTGPEKHMKIDFPKDIICCRAGDSFFGQVITERIPFKFKKAVVDATSGVTTNFYVPVTHTMLFDEYDINGVKLGKTYEHSMEYNVNYYLNISNATLSQIADWNRKKLDNLTSACVFTVHDPAAAYIKIGVKLEIPPSINEVLEGDTDGIIGKSSMVDLEGVFLYRRC